MGQSRPVRIVVVDPQPLFSRGLAMLLPSLSGGRAEVVATTCSAADAATTVRRYHPELALVDLGLPAPGGLRAIAAIRRTEPGVAVIAMAGEEDRGPALRAVHIGARGVLSKTAEPENLLTPLLALVEGWAVVPGHVLEHLAATGGTARRLRDQLGDEERRLWRLLSTGRTLAQIAVEMHVSERTVKRLIAALLRRLGVTSRTEAAALAGQSGLLDGVVPGGRPTAAG
ncbi:two component transcriptional regulator, LuxR family [Amycolatopsis marina]|uniref:Two component transcriptional regulator, LuxR family n=1 Tax=Amycolatopsis marina TaxID=490629 RepID=A0A1I0Z1R7_9PSEU|nr:response regulator transcription factor [Amycolatopsis marina]SFB19491.1 two component transcriptional regulator, LuxR family [Amycolatopsis marina]